MSARCAVPVISVGNITTGGTGKTPVVRFLARLFRARGIRVAIVSRGYGRGGDDVNDEALELEASLPDVPHVQNPDRVEAARVAVQELETQLIVMDDGFQHRPLARDLDIVVIDATCPFGYGYLLPRGLLREPLNSLSRADLILLSRCGDVPQATIEQIEAELERHAANVPRVHCDHQPSTLLTFPDQQSPLSELQQTPVAAVSAIGNPDAFCQTIARCGGVVVAERKLPDHDAYNPETVKALDDWIRSLGDSVERVVCTHKDLVKLKTDRLGGKPLVALLIELAVIQQNDLLEKALLPFAKDHAD